MYVLRLYYCNAGGYSCEPTTRPDGTTPNAALPAPLTGLRGYRAAVPAHFSKDEQWRTCHEGRSSKTSSSLMWHAT